MPSTGDRYEDMFENAEEEQAVNVIARELTNTKFIRIKTTVNKRERLVLSQIENFAMELRGQGLDVGAEMIEKWLQDYYELGCSVDREREKGLMNMFNSVWNKVQQKETIIGGPQK